MISPFSGKEAIEVLVPQTRTYRHESYEIWEHHYRCPVTGNRFTTPEQDQLNLTQIHNQYRTRHRIPFPEEIRQIREQYGLSASRMSEFLDLGVNSFRLYEQGEMPSLANARLIRLAANPINFKTLVQEKQHIFSQKTYQRLMERLDREAPDQLPAIVAYLWNFHLDANEFTGYVKPRLEKVAQFVTYFASHVQPLKTKLNKLLFLADFLHFKRFGFAISGFNYRAIPYGPVPSHYHELFGILQNEGYLHIEEEHFENGGQGERFKAARDFDESLFRKDELEVMREVIEKYQSLRTADLVALCHEEPAWIENHEKRNLINYQQYAFALKAG